MNNLQFDKVKTISGIDTLYYSIISNENYEAFFEKMVEDINTQKEHFASKSIQYKKRDIGITIQERSFSFDGNVNGFYWFSEDENLFRVGFKNPKTNLQQHNIKIEHNAIGIYTVGMHTLLDFIDELLSDISSSTYHHLTRSDINIFVQADLSFIQSWMFSSKKHLVSNHITENGNLYEIDTITIGKNPFKLRIYNKSKELNSPNSLKKKALMESYFIKNGFEENKVVYNIEFEMHRDFFKRYKIKTVEELFENVDNLFHIALGLVCLKDMQDKTKEQFLKNKSRFPTHPLWIYLAIEYSYDKYKQSSNTLLATKKVENPMYYDLLLIDLVRLIKNAKNHQYDTNLMYAKALNTYETTKLKGKITNFIRLKKYDKDGKLISEEVLADGVVSTSCINKNPQYLSDTDITQTIYEIEHKLAHENCDLEYLSHKLGKFVNEGIKRGILIDKVTRVPKRISNDG